MATIKEYFTKDFNRLLNVAAEHKATVVATGEVIPYTVRVHLDFDSCSKFISIYVPSGLDSVSITKFYADDISQALKIADSVQVGEGFGGLGFHTMSPELVFTGRIFVYAEDDVEKEAVAQMQQYCKAKGIKLVIRAVAYKEERTRHEKPEAFISHDSRDKKEVAEPIAVGLQKLMCPVWYDEFTLKVGDSLRASIEKGIKEAKKCIVILSPNFFTNEGWTKAEFDSIYTKEIIEKENVMLPVWHNVTKREVYDYSPRLADKYAVNTSVGMDEVIRHLHISIRSKT